MLFLLSVFACMCSQLRGKERKTERGGPTHTGGERRVHTQTHKPSGPRGVCLGRRHGGSLWGEQISAGLTAGLIARGARYSPVT